MPGFESITKTQKKKNKKMVNVKKITAEVHTTTGRAFKVSEVGFSTGGLTVEASRDILFGRRSKDGFFRVQDGLELPLSQILEVRYEVEDFMAEEECAA